MAPERLCSLGDAVLTSVRLAFVQVLFLRATWTAAWCSSSRYPLTCARVASLGMGPCPRPCSGSLSLDYGAFVLFVSWILSSLVGSCYGGTLLRGQVLLIGVLFGVRRVFVLHAAVFCKLLFKLLCSVGPVRFACMFACLPLWPMRWPADGPP